MFFLTCLNIEHIGQNIHPNYLSDLHKPDLYISITGTSKWKALLGIDFSLTSSKGKEHFSLPSTVGEKSPAVIANFYVKFPSLGSDFWQT